MTDRSANLSLPYMQPSQAQKHVTFNEALGRLDALVQLSIASADQTIPPDTPMLGDRYVIPLSATGEWSGRAGELAVREDSGWVFLTPKAGWSAWVLDRETSLTFDGAAWIEGPTLQNRPMIGINTTADPVNRVAVSADASLFTHDGDGHQLKVNKSVASATSALLFQTAWSGRAEIGLLGSDDLELKVSSDGTNFKTAIRTTSETGKVHFPNGVDGVTDPALGSEAVPTIDYVAARVGGLVSNGADHLGSGYNFPPSLLRDPVVTPGLPAAFCYSGYASPPIAMTEAIPVDPNLCYQMSCYIRQEGLPGDWSSYANAERHRQGLGLICLDSAHNVIEPQFHMRHRSGGTDSLTTLTAPLAPGDTAIFLTDASGWNDSEPEPQARGIILFGYKNSEGQTFDYYSRIMAHDLFDSVNVNKIDHSVTLNAPFSGTLANPDDAGGVWPVGTRIANTALTTGHKMCLFDDIYVQSTDQWYRGTNHIGGTDKSGMDRLPNFAPGTAFVRPFWKPNHSNLPGGQSGHPDTGEAHRVWFAGISLETASHAVTVDVTTGPASGSVDLIVPVANLVDSRMDLAEASLKFTAI